MFVLCHYNFHKEKMKVMQEVVNEEFFEELAADYEFKSKSIKKWWNMLTSSFDFIQNDDMGACCLSRVADYRSQSNDASKINIVEIKWVLMNTQEQ